MNSILCLGSGLAPRYRLNALTALALPSGARIQFRYKPSLVAKSLRDKLEHGKLSGAEVLLGYVDCTAGGRVAENRCYILPYRYSRLISSRKVGSVFILQLQVCEFALADAGVFQKTLSGDLPRWSGQKDPIGEWCSELPRTINGIERTESLEDWEKIVGQIRQREDFSKVAYFYTIEGLFERGNDKSVPLSEGEYVLRTNKHYEFRVYHIDPDSDAHTGNKETQWLRVGVIGEGLRIPTTPLLAIDSPYDLKTIRLISGSGVMTQHASIILKDEGILDKRNNDEKVQRLELYLPVKLKSALFRTSLYALILAALLGSQQFLLLLAQEPLKAPVRMVSAAIILSVVTGVFLAFGLRKPV